MIQPKSPSETNRQIEESRSKIISEISEENRKLNLEENRKDRVAITACLVAFTFCAINLVEITPNLRAYIVGPQTNQSDL